MKIKKIYYYLGSALLFIVVTLIIGATDIKNILLSFGAYFLGLYVIYSYLNGQVIHFGGITIKNEASIMLKVIAHSFIFLFIYMVSLKPQHGCYAFC